MDDAVAIIGIAGRFPGAVHSRALETLLTEGRTAFQAVPRQRWDHRIVHSLDRRATHRTAASQAGFVPDFDRFCPEYFGFSPKRARIMDPQQRLMLEVTRQALDDAGYRARRLANGRVGVYVGASCSDHRALSTAMVNLPLDLAGRSGTGLNASPEEIVALTAALPAYSGYNIIGQQTNMIAAHVSAAFDFCGPSFTLDTACSSALVALHEAAGHLRSGQVDAAVVGGVYVLLDPAMMVSFSSVGALSLSDRCRPFGTTADGFMLGEGVGTLVLKRLADAQRDGDAIAAIVCGSAVNNNGASKGAVTPSAAGQEAVMAAAWAAAGRDPAEVGALEAHGTATPVGDEAELTALRHHFAGATRRGPVSLGAVKANLGHGLAAAGMASLLKTVLALRTGVHFAQPGAAEARDEVGDAGFALEGRTRRWADTRRLAGVSGFGFGGTNAHVVMEAPAAAKRLVSGPAAPVRWLFSAPNEELLSQYMQACYLALGPQQSSVTDQGVAAVLDRRERHAATRTVEARDDQSMIAVLGDAVGFSTAPDPIVGVNWAGEVHLPPVPLPERAFWLVDEKLRTASRRSAGPVVRPAGQAAEWVWAALAEVTGRPVDSLQPTDRLKSDLGFDSLMQMELWSALAKSWPADRLPRAIPAEALEWTVETLVRELEKRAEAPIGGVTYGPATTRWWNEHRPAGQAVLPLTAWIAALAELGTSWVDFSLSGRLALADAPIRLELRRAGETRISVSVTDTGISAQARPWHEEVEWPRSTPKTGNAGALSLADFYGLHAFHGPTMRALAMEPLVTAEGFEAAVFPSDDPVFVLDGALQAALYWLVARGETPDLPTAFAELHWRGSWRDVVAWSGRVRSESSGSEGDFFGRNAAGEICICWRGVRTAQTSSVSSADWRQWEEIRVFDTRRRLAEAGPHNLPFFQVSEPAASGLVRMATGEQVTFSSYDYLGLTRDPRVLAASAAAGERWGTSAQASRIAGGEREIHRELETALADFLDTEDCLTLVGGYGTNVAVISHLLGAGDVLVHDKLAHACILAGGRASGAQVRAFRHNDMADLERVLGECRGTARRVLIAVEGVYSMDGDLVPLPEVVALKKRYDALLLVDEAHSLGVVGATGRGVAEHFGVPRADVDLWMGTLSKALASCGGYLAGARELLDYLRYTMPDFVFSVGLPPPQAAAARAALAVLATEPERVQRLRARSAHLREAFCALKLDTGEVGESAVVPWILGESNRVLAMAARLGQAGFHVQPIIAPAVDEHAARLRFFVTAEHTVEQLDALGAAISQLV